MDAKMQHFFRSSSVLLVLAMLLSGQVSSVTALENYQEPPPGQIRQGYGDFPRLPIVAPSVDGQTLALYLIEGDRATQLAAFEELQAGHGSAVARLSPNGEHVAVLLLNSWNGDSTLVVVSVEDGRCVTLDRNYVFIQPQSSFSPDDIDSNWSDANIVMLFGCSVLEIGDYNNWWNEPEWCPLYPPDGHERSPGLKWIEKPGSEVWLGFQDVAPKIGENNGEEAIFTWANRYGVGGVDPIEAWREATENSHKYRAAVAADEEAYYFWQEHCWFGQETCREAHGRFCIKHIATYEWMGVPLNQIGSLGLTALVIPSANNVALHIYDESGRHLGPRADGILETEIPNALYLSPQLAGGPIPGTQRATIPGADLTDGYTLELHGTSTGSFNLFLEVPDCQVSVLHHTTFISVPVTTSSTLALPLQNTDFYLTSGDNGTKITPTAHWTSALTASSCGQ